MVIDSVDGSSFIKKASQGNKNKIIISQNESVKNGGNQN